MSKRSKLDRDSVFNSLLGDIKTLQSEGLEQQTLSLGKIVLNERQPRKYIDEDSLAALTDSVRQHGVIEPVLVRPVDDHFELIAGERRTRAARAAGLNEVRAVILYLDEAQALEVSVIENLQREDLNPVEETDAILNLLAIRLAKPVADVLKLIQGLYNEARGRSGNNVISTTEKEQVEEIFRMVGRFTPSSFYTNRIPILQFPAELLQAVRTGKLHYTKAKRIARVENPELRSALLERTLREGLSVVALEAEVRQLSSLNRTPDRFTTVVKEVRKRLSSAQLARLSSDERQEAERLLERLRELLNTR